MKTIGRVLAPLNSCYSLTLVSVDQKYLLCGDIVHFNAIKVLEEGMRNICCFLVYCPKSLAINI